MTDVLFNWRGARVGCCVLSVCFLITQSRASIAQPAGGAAAPAAPSDSEPPAAEGEGDADAAPSEADEAAAAAAELDAEEKASEAKLQKPPPKGKGVVWGAVTDTKFNEAVVEAQVQVQGTKQKAFADLEGRYRLELPPGTYQLRVSYELHRPSRVEVVVKAGALVRVDFQLVPDEKSVEEVVIEEQADRSSAEGTTLERKRSAAVGDGVGRAEIARTPDRNAAEAAQRVVGATIIDGRFVYVRGLGERYTNALLNGSPLPSTEPDRNTVPLDLFPSLVLESLTINKQFLPDMPADFAGGSVRINTRQFPKQPLLELSISGAYNTESTGEKRPGYVGSNTDWLGFDGGRRSFPSGIPNTKLDASSTTTQEQVSYGHRFNTPMITFMKSTPPDFRASLVAGNSFKVGTDTKLGVVTALNYGRQYRLADITTRRFRPGMLPDGTQTLLVDSEYYGKRAIDSVRWGAFGSAALEIARKHTVTLIGMHSQNGDDGTWDLETPGGAGFHTTHLEYVSRALNFVQLRGEHHFPKLADLEIDWHTSYATADRDQPDMRDVRYQRGERDGVPGFNFVSDLSGQHQFLKQSDQTVTGGLDILQPLVRNEAHETKLKVGTLIASRRRDFNARRFQLVPSRTPGSLFNELSFCPGGTWAGGCPNYLFRPELVRPDGLLLDENTQAYDAYKTGLDVYAAYAMLDAKVLPKLRAVAGVRAEITYQAFNGFDPFDPTKAPARSQIYQTDWLPALSLVYEVTPKSNVRFGGSQTLARPQLRELSPSLSSSAAGDYSVQGNPGLLITKITNLDLRYEYFPTLREVLAVSVFYKHFKDPIEEIVSGNGILGFTNAEKADLIGGELEGRASLASLAAVLKDFSAIANLTLVKSVVELGSRKAAATNDNRPLANQSPYVINVALDYGSVAQGFDVRVLYNIFGPRITAVGSNGLPDIYEMPRNSLDFSAAKKFGRHIELKFQVLNILGAPVVFAYKDQQAYRQDATGQSYESLGRNPEVNRWDPGTTFALTGTLSY
ncbi:MAG TPA: TonB-dependent receptor [Polyangiaceae bacterium]|nr:TonB-dependent receptor [Polyangiaceae bacterium]